MIKTKDKLGAEELFKISRFREKIMKTVPHKHGDYYELIFLRQGEGFHWIETDMYPIKAPEFYFMKPGQLHCWQFTSLPTGFVILFNEDFFDPLTEVPQKELLRNLKETMQIKIPADFDPTSIFEDIFQNFKHQTEFGSHLIRGYLQVLFAKMLQLSNSAEAANRKISPLYERFLKLLSQKCPELHQVNDYARLLNTSPQNLNAVCRKNNQQSASEHITRQLLLEAKRYILHTEKTINEIAFTLFFNDASYFIKFFKKQVGLTPTQFREKYFQ